MMPVLDDDIPVANRVRTRNVMYIPCFLVPSLLRTTGYMPQEFWQIALPLLQDADKLVDCGLVRCCLFPHHPPVK